MRSIISLDNIPESGIYIIREGNRTRLFFDFEPYISPDGQSENEYSCENVDVINANYNSIVAAIIKDKYTFDKRESIFANYEEAKDLDSTITDEKREEYVLEYTDFQEYRKKAKQIAKLIV